MFLKGHSETGSGLGLAHRPYVSSPCDTETMGRNSIQVKFTGLWDLQVSMSRRQVFRSGPHEGSCLKCSETLFFMLIKNLNYVRRQIQQSNERLYHTLTLLLKYFLIAGKATFEDFILSNPDTYLYNRLLDIKAKELKPL